MFPANCQKRTLNEDDVTVNRLAGLTTDGVEGQQQGVVHGSGLVGASDEMVAALSGGAGTPLAGWDGVVTVMIESQKRSLESEGGACSITAQGQIVGAAACRGTYFAHGSHERGLV